MLFAVLFLGGALGQTAISSVLKDAKSIAEVKLSNTAVQASSDCTSGPIWTSQRAVVVSESMSDRRITLRFEKSTPPLKFGHYGSISGKLEPLSFDVWGKRALLRGEVAIVQVDDMHVVNSRLSLLTMVLALRERTIEWIAPNRDSTEALVCASVTGNTQQLNNGEIEKSFSRTGLSHLIAVSGSHLALIALLLQLFLKKFLKSSSWQTGLVLFISALYVLFSGLQPSALRSWGMLCFTLVGGLVGRRKHALSGLSLAVIIMLMLDPFSSFSLGFQLSALSVSTIVLFSPYLNHVFSLLIPRLLKWMSEPLSLTLAAQLGTVPLTIGAFGDLSLIAPLANAVCALPMSATIMLGFIASIINLIFPFFADFVLAGASVCAKVSIWIAQLCSDIPFATISVSKENTAFIFISMFLLITWWIWWPHLSKTSYIFVLLLPFIMILSIIVVVPIFIPPRVIAMDVGQGDSILLQDGSKELLVDTGPKGKVKQALARSYVTTLDALLITHFDEDHMGGLSELSDGGRKIGTIFVSLGVLNNLDTETRTVLLTLSDNIVEVQKGDRFTIGSFTCTVLSPDGNEFADKNEGSIVLFAEQGGLPSETTTFLLTGDAPESISSQVIEEFNLHHIDVLKVPHHGSRDGISLEDLSKLSPDVSVISVGDQNRYGHPDPVILEHLSRVNTNIFRTDVQGDIRIYPHNDTVRVTVSR